jgi:hypothetical protein
MPSRRWLEYDTPPGPPLRRGHSAFGIAASAISLVAIAAVVLIERRLLPGSLLPLAIPIAGLGSLGALIACSAASLDQTCKHTFTWVGASMTGAIPLAAWLASEPMVQLIKSLLPQ